MIRTVGSRKEELDLLERSLILAEGWALTMPEDAEPIAFELDLSPWRADEEENRKALVVSLVLAHYSETPRGLDKPESIRIRKLEASDETIYLAALSFDLGPLDAACIYAVIDRSPAHKPGDEVRLPVYAVPVNELEENDDALGILARAALAVIIDRIRKERALEPAEEPAQEPAQEENLEA